MAPAVGAHHNVHDRPDVQAAMRRAIATSKTARPKPGDCAAGCGVRMDAVLLAEGWTMHPSCEFPALRWTEAERLQAIRNDGIRRRQRGQQPIKGTRFYDPRRNDEQPDPV